MADAIDPSAPSPAPSSSPRPLPPRPSLEYLKNQAKERLDELRAGDPAAQLSDAQYAVAREYGFASWRAMKAHVDEAAGRAPGISATSSEIIDAARAGRVDELRALLDAHPHLVNARNADGGSALQHAAWRDRAACVRLLLDRGADVTLRVGAGGSGGDLPIHYAAETAGLDVVGMLVEAGSDVNDERDHHRLGVLGWATCFGPNRAVAEYLLSRGARHTLWTAVAMDDVGVLRGMLDADPSLVHARMTGQDHRRTPLHLAVRRNAGGAVGLLLARGADVHATDDEGLTPLASQAADGRIVEMLLGAGATMDFAAALSAGRFDVAERLLAEDPGRLMPGGRDADVLTRAVQRGDHAAARWLLEHGADASAKSDVGERGATPLHHAVLRDDVAMLDLLLSRGADPSVEDDHYHGTPLGWADYTNKPAAAAFLRERGAPR